MSELTAAAVSLGRPFCTFRVLLPCCGCSCSWCHHATQSHRTMTRVTSISSPQLLSLLLVISLVVAAAVIPFWDQIIVVATLFFLTNPDQVRTCITIMFVHDDSFCCQYTDCLRFELHMYDKCFSANLPRSECIFSIVLVSESSLSASGLGGRLINTRAFVDRRGCPASSLFCVQHPDQRERNKLLYNTSRG